MRRPHGHSRNNKKNSVLKFPGVPLVEHPCPKMESGNLRTEASSWSKGRSRLGRGVMIHNSERLWLSISVVWAALLLQLCYLVRCSNFERMKNGPARAKSLGPFLLLTASTALHVR